jgi:MFS family permease
MVQRPAALIFLMCSAEVLGMAGYSTFPALVPELQTAWQLTNVEIGWLSGIYFGGYTIAVPILVSLTDRIDPKRIYLLSTGLVGIGTFAFGWFADGFWSALILRAIAGAGFAGTYMPGLKAISDRLSGPQQSRAVSIYTSSFSIGASLSLVIAGVLSEIGDWRLAFLLSAMGSALAFALVAFLLPANPPQQRPDARLLDFRPVLRECRVMGFVAAYTTHSYELFAFRSWLVAFLVYVQMTTAGAELWSATAIAAAINLLGMPASISTNEIAVRRGRRGVVLFVLILSTVASAVMGLTPGLPFLLVVLAMAAYGYLIAADSGSITAGSVAAAPEGYRGATMAVHSTFGFAGGFLGPLAVGVALDAAGGQNAMGWWLGFLAMGAPNLLGAAILYACGRRIDRGQ